MSRTDWDRRFLGLAEHIASWSKDESTKVGAAIVDFQNRVVSVGYNGFARGIEDDHRLLDREIKYKIIIHAERNALLFAQRDLYGHTLYVWPFMPCSSCASMIIQAGIRRCVAPPTPEDKRERWGADMAMAAELLKEAGVLMETILI